MIIRKRQKPRLLEKFEALHARLSTKSPQYHAVKFQKEKYEKGYKGELKVDYYLNILAPQYTIIQDVSLSIYGQMFQMDNLIISPNAIYLIDVKNYSHTITFDTELNQFIQNNGKNVSGYNHPITQVKLQKLRLQNWLQENNFPDIPIHPFIAISSPSTIIKVEGNHNKIKKIVGHGEQIPWKIMDLEKELESNQQFQHQKIGYQILRNCFAFDKNIFNEFPIRTQDILSGIRCMNCNHLNMQRRGKTWACPKCSFSDSFAPQHSIKDYLLLIKPYITNKECREFLKIESRYAMRRILNRTPELEYVPPSGRWEKKK